jgi:pimeloyl-ACP methyl ester carboxylesterase
MGMNTAKSADGTVIAYEAAGSGPVLLVCVGAFCDRHTFSPTDELTSQFTVVNYDRRGRGDSGDTQPFAPEREYEDLAAVAEATGSAPPFLYGHSSGAAIVMRAVAAGMPAAGLAAYEAPFNDEPPVSDVDPAGRIRELVAAGRERDAVLFWMSDVVRMPAQAVEGMAKAPWLVNLEPLARTLPYDLGVAGTGIPVGELGRIAVPALVLGGGNSPDWFRQSVADQAAAIPGAQLRMLDGRDHNVPHEVISPILASFFSSLG